MAFFADAVSDWRPGETYEPAIWEQPPRGVIPGTSSQTAELFRTNDWLLWVGRFASFPEGITFRFTLMSRLRDQEPLLSHFELNSRGSEDRVPDDYLRLGVLLFDGSTWTNLDFQYPDEGDVPDGPVVTETWWEGGGISPNWTVEYWMWPLPPDGPIDFVAEWPAFGIEETRAELDASELRARAGEAEVVWLE